MDGPSGLAITVDGLTTKCTSATLDTRVTVTVMQGLLAASTMDRCQPV
jgi:hypothetical protein